MKVNFPFCVPRLIYKTPEIHPTYSHLPSWLKSPALTDSSLEIYSTPLIIHFTLLCVFSSSTLLLIPHTLHAHIFGQQRRASRIAEECSAESGGDLKFPLAVSRLSGGWMLWCANCPDQRCGLSTPWLPFGPCVLVRFAQIKVCVFWGKKESEASPLLSLEWTWIWNMAGVCIWI